MEKEEKLFAAICKVLNSYKKDGITITQINSQPEIIAHLPKDKDKSYMEDWKEVTINILVKGKKAGEDNNGHTEKNYRVENAKFKVNYNLKDEYFTAEVKEILSICDF